MRVSARQGIGADPSEEEFHSLFRLYLKSFGCEYRREIIEDLLDKHYRRKHGDKAYYGQPR